MAEQPGFMVYHDTMAAMESLSFEDKGKMLDAMNLYSQTGVLPDFDGVLAIVFGFIKPKMDADAKRYRKKIVKTTYSSYCAKAKRSKEEPLEFSDWLDSIGIDDEGNRTVPLDTVRFPNIESTQNTKINSISNPNPNPAIEPKINAAGKGRGVEEGKPDPNDFNAMRNAAFEKLRNYPG